jgi:hypothetical protein
MKRRTPTDFNAMPASEAIVHDGSLSAAERAFRIPKATLSRKLDPGGPHGPQR